MVKKVIKILTEVLTVSISLTVLLTVVFVAYLGGYRNGLIAASQEKEGTSATLEKGETKVIYVTPQPAISRVLTWGGPDLWEAVNKRRTEFGVNPLKKRDELCTIASIRLNQLLELGKLDGHEGFSKLPETRPDLKWIFEKYNISEFLVAGANSASEAVSLWENTLGHRQLLSGGEYVWGCTYAQNGFGVAIAAY